MTEHATAVSQSGPISPDCEARKCPCTGDAMDAADQIVPCAHPCHAIVTGTFPNTEPRLAPEAMLGLVGQRAYVTVAADYSRPAVGQVEVLAVRSTGGLYVEVDLRWALGDPQAVLALAGRIGVGYLSLERDDHGTTKARLDIVWPDNAAGRA